MEHSEMSSSVCVTHSISSQREKDGWFNCMSIYLYLRKKLDPCLTPCNKIYFKGFDTGFPWWLSICLPMQGTWVQSLLEDFTCCGSPSLCPTTIEPTCCKYWCSLALEPMLCNKRSCCNEKPAHCRLIFYRRPLP